MEVDTCKLVLIGIGYTNVAVAVLPRIRRLILLRRDNLRGNVLLELDDRRLVNDHKVDILRAFSLDVAARLFAGGDTRGALVANEVSPERLETLRDTLTRCGFAEQIRLTSCDGTQVAAALPGETFDRILLDVPCSNTGVLGRRADARWGWSVRKLEALCQTQTALLEACAPLLRPGGRLVYSTCSIEPEEDAQQIARFLATHPAWHCAEALLILPEPGHDGAYAALLTR